jgi:hypothetical protein
MPESQFTDYINAVQLPEARRGVALKNLYGLPRTIGSRNQGDQTGHGKC